MRLLVVIPHYVASRPDESAVNGSGGPSLPRIAALSEQIQSLFSYFGPNRTPRRSDAAPGSQAAAVDVVVMSRQGSSILDRIAADSRHVSVEYCDCDPLMLIFEAQRVLRDRFGSYDLYAMMEDDLIIRDPLFLDKVQWFAGQFGETRLLQPHRYEMSKRGVIRKALIEPIFKPQPLFAKDEHPPRLSGNWRGFDIGFEQPGNPHAGCYFLTAAQLRYWMDQPWFYDRNPDWIGPLESGGTRSLAQTFAVYKPVEAQADFLEIEHFGTRFSNMNLDFGEAFEQSVIYSMAEAGRSSDRDAHDGTLPDMEATVAALRREVLALRRVTGSRTRLLKEFFRQLLSKSQRR